MNTKNNNNQTISNAYESEEAFNLLIDEVIKEELEPRKDLADRIKFICRNLPEEDLDLFIDFQEEKTTETSPNKSKIIPFSVISNLLKYAAIFMISGAVSIAIYSNFVEKEQPVIASTPQELLNLQNVANTNQPYYYPAFNMPFQQNNFQQQWLNPQSNFIKTTAAEKTAPVIESNITNLDNDNNKTMRVKHIWTCSSLKDARSLVFDVIPENTQAKFDALSEEGLEINLMLTESSIQTLINKLAAKGFSLTSPEGPQPGDKKAANLSTKLMAYQIIFIKE